MTSAAAKKAWATRRKKYGKDGHAGPPATKEKKTTKKKAKRKGKAWGPGHPLYEYLKAKTGKAPAMKKKKGKKKAKGKKKTKAERSAIAQKAARHRG